VTMIDKRTRTDINTEERSRPHDTVNALVLAGTTWKKQCDSSTVKCELLVSELE
jgi:hypothetical protein